MTISTGPLSIRTEPGPILIPFPQSITNLVNFSSRLSWTSTYKVIFSFSLVLEDPETELGVRLCYGKRLDSFWYLNPNPPLVLKIILGQYKI